AAAVSMPILNKADLLMISPTCTWPGLTKAAFAEGEPDKHRPSGKVNFLRVAATDDHQGPVAARYAADDLKLKTVYVLDDGDVYGKGVADQFEKAAKQLGLKVVGHESIDDRQKEFAKLMVKIKEQKPDAVYFGGTSQSGGPEIARDLAKSQPGTVLLLPDG